MAKGMASKAGETMAKEPSEAGGPRESTGASLKVTLVEAKYLPPLTNAYVKLALGGSVLNSSEQSTTATGRVVWDDTLLFTESMLSILYKEKFTATICDSDSNNVLGSFSVSTERLSMCKEVDCWFHMHLPPDQRDNAPDPMIRLLFTMSGPLRPQINRCLNLLNRYTGVVDHGLEMAGRQAARVTPLLWNRWALVPAIPLSVVLLAAAPFVVVGCVAGAPLLLPLAIAAAVVLLFFGVVVLVVAAGSSSGRRLMSKVVDPCLDTLTETATGQQVLYATGPVPSIFELVMALAPQRPLPKLVCSVIVDAIGCSSYLIPGLGEATDLFWAPISALLIHSMYSKSSPYAAYIGFAEEVLPFTDVIPTACMAWLREFGPGLIDQAIYGQS